MFGDLDDLDDLLLPDDPFPAAEPPPDAPLLSVEWDGEHVVRLGLTNNWRQRGTVEELAAAAHQALIDKLSDQPGADIDTRDSRGSTRQRCAW